VAVSNPPKIEHRIREFFGIKREAGMEAPRKSWEQIEEGLTQAMKKLSEAINKAMAEMPDAMKSINEEYLRVQEALDRAVDKLRK
jgi:sugar-specific transcriptional regulator TrmB